MIRKILEGLIYGNAQNFEIATRPPIFFMHIPKTAGMSVRQFLANQYHKEEICPWSNWRELARADRELGSFKLIQGHFGINVRDILPSRFRTLIMLRDPIERTLSAIRHLQRDPHFHPLHGRIKDMTVSEILRDNSLAFNFRNAQTGYLSAQQSPRDVIRYLTENKSAYAEPWDIEGPPDLDRAKRSLDSIQFVGFCEDIQGLFPSLCNDMLFHYPTFPPRVNVAPVDAGLGLTEEDWSVLRNLNDLDIELYNHARATRDRRVEQAFDAKAFMRKECAEGVYRMQTGSFALDLNDCIPGSGWYEAERKIRWTGPRREFTLELPIEASASYRVRLRFMSPLKLRAGNFRIFVNGEDCPVRLRRHWGTSYSASCVIERSALARSNGFCQMTFQTAEVFRPGGSRSADARSLGVAMRSIAFDRLET